jgi:UDPglucose--hexose-1-phosphate uridylyltransferase
MSDLRHDPIDDTWVTMAGNRRSRPMEYQQVSQRRKAMICPFCRGNEVETTAAIAVYGNEAEPLDESKGPVDWLSRVISNKYPSFSTATNDDAQEPSTGSGGQRQVPPPFRISGNPGRQELIIPSPRHLVSIGELTDQELEVSFFALQQRVAAMNVEENIEHAMLFLNCRPDAGASLGHIHWQLIGSPLVSSFLQRRIDREQSHQDEFGESIVKRLVDWEIKQQDRVIRQTKHFAIVCPFASRFPFQVNIVPLNPDISFQDCSAVVRDELAWHCRDIVGRLEILLEDSAYNILLQSPVAERTNQDPWYLQIFPRITKPAGFELGTDLWINPVLPESAARALRVAKENSGSGV